jgi:hypothetical protein
MAHKSPISPVMLYVIIAVLIAFVLTAYNIYKGISNTWAMSLLSSNMVGIVIASAIIYFVTNYAGETFGWLLLLLCAVSLSAGAMGQI